MYMPCKATYMGTNHKYSDIKGAFTNKEIAFCPNIIIKQHRQNVQIIEKKQTNTKLYAVALLLGK